MKKILTFSLLIFSIFEATTQNHNFFSTRRWLFIDPNLIEEKTNIEIRVNSPLKYDVVKMDTSIMNYFGQYMTIIDDNGKLMMWRSARDKDDKHRLQCFVSTDGLTWFPSSKDETVDFITSGFDEITETEGCVFIDPTAPPESKFKNVASFSKKGLFVSRSSDGIHWKRDEKPILYFDFDSPNVTFWDTKRNTYALYLRGWILGNKSVRRRTVVHTTSSTLDKPLNIIPNEWDTLLMGKYNIAKAHECTNEIPTVIKTDESDPPLSDFYTNAVVQYPVDPYYYLAFPSMYIHFPEPDTGKSRNDGILYTQFAGSVDGVNYYRYNRPVYAMPHYPGFGPSSMTYMATGIIIRGNEIWQYANSYQCTHGRGGVKYPEAPVTFRFIQRIDGFVSADSQNHGKMLTRPIPCNGKNLILNLNVEDDGYAKVGMFNEKGKAISKFKMEKCDVIKGDHVDYTVTWNGSSDLTSLVGKNVKLLIKSKKCKIYSFRYE